MELVNVLQFFGTHTLAFLQDSPSHCKSRSKLIKQGLGTGETLSLHWGDILSWLDAGPRPQQCPTLRCTAAHEKSMIELTFSMYMVCQQLLSYRFQMASGQKTERGALWRCPGC